MNFIVLECHLSLSWVPNELLQAFPSTFGLFSLLTDYGMQQWYLIPGTKYRINAKRAHTYS